MADTIFKYPLDLLGTSSTNKAIDESHTIGSVKGRIFVADYGPFFGNSTLILKDGVTGRVLVPNDDYALVHHYREATARTGQAIYTAVRITNPNVSTNILMTCQYVGGEFSFSTYALKQAIEELMNDDRPVYWGDLIGVPSQFVPAPHLHSAYDLYGMKYVVEAQVDVANAIREGDAASRALLLKQVQDKFLSFDSFAKQLADCFQAGATELAAIQ